MQNKTTTKNAIVATENTNVKRKILTGVVVSDKMKDTIVVRVGRFVKDPKYKKFITYHKRYKVHDAGNTKKVGETVMIESCRPISKHKSFKVI